MSDNLQDLTMPDDLRELLEIPPVRFIKMLENSYNDLDTLHDNIVPALRRRITDHTVAQCAEIQTFLDDTGLQLGMASLLRSASGLILPMFSASEVVEMDNWLDMIAVFEEELKKAVEWLHGVLDKCAKKQ